MLWGMYYIKKRYFLLATVLLVVLLSLLPSVQAQISIYGRVFGPDNNPLGGVIVEAYLGNTLVGKTTTADSGLFSLRLNEGSYTFVIYKRGYEKLVFSMHISRDKAGDIGIFKLGYALRIIPEAYEIVTKQGSSVAIKLRVENRGAYPLYIETETNPPPGWQAIIQTDRGLEVKNLVLEVGEERELYLSIIVARNSIGAQKVDVIFRYDNFTHLLNITVHVEPREWGLISTDYSSINAYPGVILNIPLIVKNNLGIETSIKLNAAAPKGWTTLFYDSRGVAVNSVRLKPDESINLNLTVNVPEKVDFGNYTITVSASGDGASSELILSIMIPEGLDILEVSLESSYFKVYAGGSLDIPFKIKNLGIGATTADLMVENIEDLKVMFRDPEGNIITSIYIPPHSEREAILTLTIPKSIEPRVMKLRLIVSGEHSTSVKDIVLEVIGRYEIEFLTKNFFVSVIPGSVSRFQLVIRNVGTLTIRDLEIITSSIPSGLKVDIKPSIIRELEPGKEKTVIFTINAESSVVQGYYNIPFTVRNKGIEEKRVIVVSVESGVGYSFIFLAIIILSIGVGAYIYSRRRRGSA